MYERKKDKIYVFSCVRSSASVFVCENIYERKYVYMRKNVCMKDGLCASVQGKKIYAYAYRTEKLYV